LRPGAPFSWASLLKFGTGDLGTDVAFLRRRDFIEFLRGSDANRRQIRPTPSKNAAKLTWRGQIMLTKLTHFLSSWPQKTTAFFRCAAFSGPKRAKIGQRPDGGVAPAALRGVARALASGAGRG
jgi:hypothetical protein